MDDTQRSDLAATLQGPGAAITQVLIDCHQELSYIHLAPAGRLCAWVGSGETLVNVALQAVAWHCRKGKGALWCGPKGGADVAGALGLLGADPARYQILEATTPQVRSLLRDHRPSLAVLVTDSPGLLDLKIAARETGAAIVLLAACSPDAGELDDLFRHLRGVDVFAYLRAREDPSEVDALIQGGPLEHTAVTLYPPLPFGVEAPRDGLTPDFTLTDDIADRRGLRLVKA